MKFDYELILKNLEQSDNTCIRLYFQTSNSTDTVIYEGILEEDGSELLHQNIVDFFNITSIPFENQVKYDFQGKKNDETIEILELSDIEIIRSIINKTKKATSDLKNLKFKEIKSYLIELELDDSSLYLFKLFKKDMYLDMKKKSLLKLQGDSLEEAKISGEFISIPTSFDICVYKDIVFFNTHSEFILNQIIDLEHFYNETMDQAIDMVSKSNILSNIAEFKMTVDEKRDNKVIKKKLARLNTTKKQSFEELTKMHLKNVDKFKENFNKAKKDINFTFDLDSNNQIIVDVDNEAEVLSLLSFLIDAYGKTFMLEHITED